MLCNECPHRNLCTSLCPEAEMYANQDWTDLREITIGMPISISKGHNNIDDKLIHKYLLKLDKLSRKEQVITLLDMHLSRAEICQILGITRDNLKHIIKRISRK